MLILSLWSYTSSRIVEIFRDYTPLVEVFSINEAWQDVTHSLSIFGTPERISYILKARIKESFSITCSIGIAPNKLLSKLASDRMRPGGLTVILPENIKRVLEHFPLGELCGIGKKIERHLAMMCIKTCGEIGRYDVE